MQRSTPQATAGSAERTPARAAAPAARAGGGERANAPRAADLRVAYVGQAVYFGQCALESPAGGLDPVFLDFRAGAPADRLLDDLRTLDPDVVLVFRPEIVPPGLFASLRATTIGYLTEPLPRGRDGAHTDLRARLRWLEQVDRSNFDRIVSFDPLIAETASGVIDVWRAAPIPVADSLYMDVRARSTPPALLFVGRWTAHRDSLLAPAARGYPLMHIGHGLFGEPLRRVLAGADVQLNLHNNPYPTFENRVCIALAAGHLVISEPLSPSHGLVAGEHYLEAATPTELVDLLAELLRDPQAFADVQIAGRAEAERFRASAVYGSLVHDAIADVRASGGRRGRG